MGEDYSVRTVFSAEDRGMSSTFEKLAGQAGSLGERLKAGIGFGAMAKIGSAAISTVTSGLTSFASSAISAGAGFEASMSEVGAISGATGSDLAALTAKAKEMGASTKFTASESADALKYMAMAGWKTEDMLGGLEGIMSLAAASGEDLGTTSDIVTDALTAFGMAAEDSGHFADILAAASSNANTNVGMLGESFKYVAPVAGALGYSAEDTSVALGLMANAGIKGSAAGTALRTVMTNLSKPTKEMSTAMDELGLSLTDSKGEMLPLSDVMMNLREKFAGLSEEQKAQYAATLAGKEGMSGMLAIVNASEKDYNKLSEAIYNSDGAAKQMADTMQNNLSGKMTILGSAMEGLGIAAYEHVKAPFSDAVQAVTDKVGELTQSMESGRLGSIMESIGNGVKSGVETAVKWFDKLSDVMKVVIDHSDQLIAAASGIGGALAAIKVGNKFSTLAKGVTGCMSPFKSFTGLMKDGFSGTNAFLGVLEGGTGTLGKIAGSALKAGGGFKGIVSALISSVSPMTLAIGAMAGIVGGITAWCVADRDLFDTTSQSKKIVDGMKDSYEQFDRKMQSSQETRQQEIESSMAQSMEAEILAGKINDLASQEGKSASQKQYLASMVEQLNSIMPGLNLQYDQEKDKLSQTTDEINKKVEAMKAEAEIAAWKAAQESVTSDLAAATREQGKAVKELGELETIEAQAKADYAQKYSEWAAAGSSATYEQQQAMAKANATWNDAKRQTKEAREVVAQYQDQIDSLNDEFTDFSVKQQQVTAREGWEGLVSEAKKAGIEIPEKLKAGIEAGQVMVPASIDQLNSLMEWDKLTKKAEENSVQIPAKLAAGIQSGSIEPAEAVKQLNALLSPEYEAAVENAKAHGLEIPEYLSEGILSGQVMPTDAIAQINELCANFDPALQRARNAGFDIPQYLSEGMNDGSISVQEAADTLNQMADLGGLVSAAQAAGVQIPAGLAARVSEGSISVEDACSQLMLSASTTLSQTEFAAIFGDQAAAEYYSGFAQATGETAAAAESQKGAALNTLQSSNGSFTAAGQKDASEYGSGLAQGGAQATTQAKKLGADTGKAMNGKAEAKGSGAQTFSAFTSAAGSKTGEATNQGRGVRDAALRGMEGGYTPAYNNGSNIGNGLAAGMEGALPRVTSAADALVAQAQRATEAKAKIASPSKLFKKLGKFIGLGFAKGIESTAGEVAQAAADLVSIPDLSIPSAGFHSGSIQGSAPYPSGEVVINLTQEINGRELVRATGRFSREYLDTQDLISMRLKGA